jgi:hypothetical protein
MSALLGASLISVSGAAGLGGALVGLGVDSVGPRLQSNAGQYSINAQLKGAEGNLSNNIDNVFYDLHCIMQFNWHEETYL